MTSQITDQALKKISLFHTHVELGAKFIQFGGFDMPVYYPDGIQKEYMAVRKSAGLFDVSHMGIFFIFGNNATDFLQVMTINNVKKLDVGDAQYTAMCYPDGGIVDDLILYRKKEGYLLVVNAANIKKDFDWLNKHIPKNVTLNNQSDYYSLIAIQGPLSRKILSNFTSINLEMPFYTFAEGAVCDYQVMVSRTGYTGELGYEIYGNSNQIVHIWNKLTNAKAKPAGLAARDILRIEMKYCLYGNDIDKSTNPIEAGLSWITSMEGDDFFGREKLIEIKEAGISRHLIAFVLKERGIPRNNYEVYVGDRKVGYVTSGTHSPILNTGIGLAYIETPFDKIGKNISIKIRNRIVNASIIKPPFIDVTSIYN